MNYVDTWRVTSETTYETAVTALPITLEQVIAASASYMSRAESAAAHAEDLAASYVNPSWENIEGRPTTLVGYGITDVYTRTESEALITNLIGDAPSDLNTLGEIALRIVAEENARAALATTVGDHIGSAGSAHAEASTTVAGFLSSSDKAKLDTVAANATANATDAALRDRSTHTGTQAIATVTGLQTALDAKATTSATLAGYGIGDAYTKTETDGRIQAVVGAAPAALDTLQEIAAQLSTDENAVAALTATVSTKLATADAPATVRSTVLTGLSTTTNAVVAATDTVLAAIGKAQAQISAVLSSLTTHTSSTSNPHSVTKAQVGLSSVPNVDATARAAHTGTQASSTISDFAAAASAAAPVQSVVGRGGAVTLTKSDVGLGSVENLAPADLPVSTATATAISAKQNALGYTPIRQGTGVNQNNNTIAIGWGKGPYESRLALQIDATDFGGCWPIDISGAAASLASGATVPTPDAADTSTKVPTTAWVRSFVSGNYLPISASPGSTDAVPEGAVNLYFTAARASAAAPVQSVVGRGGAVTLTKSDVGLGSVENLAPADLPVSTATATAISAKQNALGYTPIRQGTGVNQNNNTIAIGWGKGPYGSHLALQIDAVDFGWKWPIDISGAAASLASGATVPTPDAADTSTKVPNTDWVRARIGDVTMGLGSASTLNTGRSVGDVPVYEIYGGVYPSILTDSTLIFSKSAQTTADWANFAILRNPPAGGTSGYVNSALLVDTTVDYVTTAFEWAFLERLTVNAAGGGEHCAGYSQVNMNSDAYGWAHVFEFRDASSVPTRGKVTCEMNIVTNGADTNSRRRILDIVLHKLNESGSTAIATHAINVGTATDCNFTNAYNCDGNADTAFNAAGTHVTGLDTANGTFTSAAIRLGANQKLALESTGAIFFRYNSSNTHVELCNGTTVLAYWTT